MDLKKYPSIMEFDHSFIGKLYIINSCNGVVSVTFSRESSLNAFSKLKRLSGNDSENVFTKELSYFDVLVSNQFKEYIDGDRRDFLLPLDYSLFTSDFQRRVLEEVAKIPYGSTATYGEIANRIGSNPRAVGAANAKNPIPIIIPCHRVVGSDGKLTGYGGGLHIKGALLRLEKSTLL